jgi:MICOS complex subunit MIC26
LSVSASISLSSRVQWFSYNVTGRIKSFRSPTEPLTPGTLYVLTSTLLGSIIARSSILLRFTLPPALFLTSAFRFLPETSTNISNYVYDLEKEFTPGLARLQTDLSRTVKNSWHSVRDGWSTSIRIVETGVQKSAGWFADTTGLKVHEVFGVTRDTSSTAQERSTKSILAPRAKVEKSLEN